jgi:hypothetical protein
VLEPPVPVSVVDGPVDALPDVVEVEVVALVLEEVIVPVPLVVALIPVPAEDAELPESVAPPDCAPWGPQAGNRTKPRRQASCSRVMARAPASRSPRRSRETPPT